MTVEQLRSGNGKTGVVVHINERLDDQHRQTIESLVEQVEGVTHACFNETQHHLMIVDYDPRRTSSGEILRQVTRQDLHAQLI